MRDMACLRRACEAGRKRWPLERGIVLVTEMGVYIFALVDDAYDFKATFGHPIKNDVPSFGKAKVSFFDFVSLFTQCRIMGQPFKALLQLDHVF